MFGYRIFYVVGRLQNGRLRGRPQGSPVQVLVILALLISSIFSCQSPTKDNMLRVVLPQTTLRDAPGEQSREIRLLQAQEEVVDIGIVSNFETQLRLEGQSLIAPWLQVKTADGQTGWIFSGAVQPVPPQTDWLLRKRMWCYFGPDLSARRDRWLATKDTISTEAGFAVFYREAVALRDTFTYHLAHRAEPNATEMQPGFYWLREALPGFVYQRIAQGTQPYLFTDYRFFQSLAAHTKGTQDDALIATYLAAYPVDSIESKAPVWTMQITDNEKVSQLGLDQHWRILQHIDAVLSNTNSLFRPELTGLKEAVLADILDKNVRYWQTKEKILAELNKIIESNLPVLNDADRASLEVRATMFQDPAAHGLQVNLRAGE